MLQTFGDKADIFKRETKCNEKSWMMTAKREGV